MPEPGPDPARTPLHRRQHRPQKIRREPQRGDFLGSPRPVPLEGEHARCEPFRAQRQARQPLAAGFFPEGLMVPHRRGLPLRRRQHDLHILPGALVHRGLEQARHRRLASHPVRMAHRPQPAKSRARPTDRHPLASAARRHFVHHLQKRLLKTLHAVDQHHQIQHQRHVLDPPAHAPRGIRLPLQARHGGKQFECRAGTFARALPSTRAPHHHSHFGKSGKALEP